MARGLFKPLVHSTIHGLFTKQRSQVNSEKRLRIKCGFDFVMFISGKGRTKPFREITVKDPPRRILTRAICIQGLDTFLDISPFGLEESPSGLIQSPSRLKESPSGLKESPSGLKESPSRLKESPSGLKESPSGLKESSSLLKNKLCFERSPVAVDSGISKTEGTSFTRLKCDLEAETFINKTSLKAVVGTFCKDVMLSVELETVSKLSVGSKLSEAAKLPSPSRNYIDKRPKCKRHSRAREPSRISVKNIIRIMKRRKLRQQLKRHLRLSTPRSSSLNSIAANFKLWYLPIFCTVFPLYVNKEPPSTIGNARSFQSGKTPPIIFVPDPISPISEVAKSANNSESSPAIMSSNSILDPAALLENRLNKIGFQPLDVGGEGDCFFRAVSHQLYGDTDSHIYIRISGVEYMRNNPERFIKSNTESSWAEYLKNMTEQDVGGAGDCFFRAVSHQLYGDPSAHLYIRISGVEYLEHHPERFIESNTECSWVEYLKNMAKQGKVPPCAVINGMQFSPKPSFFDLNELECRLLAPQLAFEKLMEAPRGRQLKIHGNIVNVPADVTNTVSSLPRLPNESGTIKVNLKRKLQYKSAALSLNIRPVKVVQAAIWLVNNKSLYREQGITLNQNLCETPENISLDVYDDKKFDQCDQTESDVPSGICNNSNKTQLDEDGWSEDDDEEIPAGVTDTMLTAANFVEEHEHHSVLNVAPAEGNKPISVFRDKYSEELAYPGIF
ncbi:hypothetical protein ACROYT_G014904 [Oculina patagonica]